MGAAAGRTGKFPRTGPKKFTQIAARIGWDGIPPDNDLVATLRVLTFDSKFLFCGHGSLGGPKADAEHSLMAHSKMYPDYLRPYKGGPSFSLLPHNQDKYAGDVKLLTESKFGLHPAPHIPMRSLL